MRAQRTDGGIENVRTNDSNIRIHRRSNGALDSRRFQRWPCERDDLEHPSLFDDRHRHRDHRRHRDEDEPLDRYTGAQS